MEFETRFDLLINTSKVFPRDGGINFVQKTYTMLLKDIYLYS